MKIAILNNMAPFTWGGAEELAVHLERNLNQAGHFAECVRIPFQWNPLEGIPSQMLLARSLDLSSADLIIALKFPAYLVEHPNKVVWLLHQFRQAYDLLELEGAGFTETPTGRSVRDVIMAADNHAFNGVRRLFTNSEVTRDRLWRFNSIPAEVLLPPLNDAELFAGAEPEGYVFAGGRINSLKRQHMLIPALAQAPKAARLVIAGPPDSPSDAARLVELVDRHKLQDRVTLDLRFLAREQYARYVNHASAVAYIPHDEDSLGYVAMEAAHAGKPVITLRDSGGILGLVTEGSTGWVAEPTVEDLGRCLAEATRSQTTCRERGERMRDVWVSLDVNWPSTIKALVS